LPAAIPQPFRKAKDFKVSRVVVWAAADLPAVMPVEGQVDPEAAEDPEDPVAAGVTVGPDRVVEVPVGTNKNKAAG
jgi:hypothetical protein